MMRKLMLLLAGISISVLAFPEVYITDAYIFSQTWTKANSPYHIMQDTELMSNRALTIEPGVRVVFHGYYTLTINAADLFAIGTPADSIVFTMHDTAGFVNGEQEDGGWNGIRLYSSSVSGDTSVFSHCQFMYCKTFSWSSGRLGVVSSSNNSRVIVEKCLFINNRAKCSGVECSSSDIHIRNNLFKNNSGEYNIATAASAPLIYENRFEGNDMDKLIYNPSYRPTIERNIFINNTATHIIDSRYNPRILNNIFIDNYCGTNYIMRLEGNPLVENNLIANNQGGGIRTQDGAILVNNTIANNTGYPIWMWTMDGGKLSGNLVYGNDLPCLYSKGEDEPEILFNLFEGGIAGFAGDAFTGSSSDNINTDPVFIDPTSATGPGQGVENANFGIEPNSPCINNGDWGIGISERFPVDLANNPRIRYGIADIGAYEGNIEKVTLPATISSYLLVVADTIYVSSDVTIEDNGTLVISAGSILVFDGRYRINNYGAIIAIGTKEEGIVFTVKDTSGFWGSNNSIGGWKGIWMDNAGGTMNDNQTTIFQYCRFEYAKWDGYSQGSALHLINIKEFILDNCTFRHNRSYSNGAGIYAINSKLDITNCLVDSNVANQQYNCDGPFFFWESDVYIANTVFRNNIAGHGTGIYSTGSKLSLENCHFYNNFQYPYSSSAGATTLKLTNTDCRFSNLVIANNKTNGAVIEFQNCTGYMNNCNIVNNQSTNSYSVAGLYFSHGHLDIRNMIFYGNRRSGYIGTINLGDDNVDPNFYNCLIEGGLSSIKFSSGFLFTGEFVNCIDKDPAFMDPSAVAGPDPDYEGSDWSLFDISPAINTGTADTAGLSLSTTDFAGNPRFKNGRIDIGALEKDAKAIEITRGPAGGIFCLDDTTILSVAYSQSDTVIFQWVKDGVNIAGANDDSLFLGGLRLSDEGNYVCRLSNALGRVNSPPVFLKVNAPPKIIFSPESRWVQPDKVLNLKVEVTGTNPLIYQWRKDGIPVPGEDLPELRFTPSDSSSEGKYTCIVSNSCGSEYSDTASIFLAAQLCMVTVHPETGYNLVVWEKKTKSTLLAYNIYRESVAAGIYDLLETVPFDNLSTYSDTVADPTVQAYLYKMTAIDMEGQETDIDLCNPHKTIHLLVSTNPELNTTQLAWDRYYGFDYQTYTIYRSNTGVNFDSIHSISSSLSSWTDPNPVSGDLFYRIAVQKPDPCFPEGGSKKAGTGPYQHSLSNMDDNKLKTGVNPPDSVMLDNNEVDENRLPGILVGRLSTVDPDTVDSHSYHLVEGDGDDDNSSFSLIGDLLITAETFDYETRNQYTIRIRSTDNSASYVELTFTITVRDTEESGGGLGENPPDTLTLSNNAILENNLIGDLIGRLVTQDPDTFDIHSYQFVSGNGDDDNSKFMILGDLLMAAHKFDFENKNQFKVRVRSTDKASNTIENEFLINVIDVDETVGIGSPSITGLRIYPNPFRESTILAFPNAEQYPYTLRIVDLAGKTVFLKQNLIEERYTLHRNDLGKGYYLLLLQGKKEYREKLVIE